jgi:hypothetical protein
LRMTDFSARKIIVPKASNCTLACSCGMNPTLVSLHLVAFLSVAL